MQFYIFRGYGSSAGWRLDKIDCVERVWYNATWIDEDRGGRCLGLMDEGCFEIVRHMGMYLLCLSSKLVIKFRWSAIWFNDYSCLGTIDLDGRILGLEMVMAFYIILRRGSMVHMHLSLKVDDDKNTWGSSHCLGYQIRAKIEIVDWTDVCYVRS